MVLILGGAGAAPMLAPRRAGPCSSNASLCGVWRSKHRIAMWQHHNHSPHDSVAPQGRHALGSGTGARSGAVPPEHMPPAQDPASNDADDSLEDDGFEVLSPTEFTALAPSGSDEDGTGGEWATPLLEQEASDADDRERVFLVGVELKSTRGHHSPQFQYSAAESLEELRRLSESAGLRVVGSTSQALDVPNPATYVGSGKVAEVARAVRALRAETVIFDDELSPGQLRNLERAMSSGAGADGAEPPVRVCDRTALILDIFSQRAQTREGQLQVELAQTEYQLPRLTRMWTHLDRVGGGGQVKGTGEKQKEIDKRLLRDKAAQLKRELESVRTHRRQYRIKRTDTPIPVVAIVGYTNAGKSTLLNTLTNAGVLAEDQLFATLDPTTRKLRLKGNKEVLISDTVGFIQKLPTELVAAFRATLEEVQDATLVLNVVDISHANAAAQNEAVMQVLKELDVQHIPILHAWNKIDCCADPQQVRQVAARRQRTVCISGLTGEGLDSLLELVGLELEALMQQVQVLLPYDAGDLLSDVHAAGRVKHVEYTEQGTQVTAFVPPSIANKLKRYIVDQPAGAAVVDGSQRQPAAGGEGQATEVDDSEGVFWNSVSRAGASGEERDDDEDDDVAGFGLGGLNGAGSGGGAMRRPLFGGAAAASKQVPVVGAGAGSGKA